MTELNPNKHEGILRDKEILDDIINATRKASETGDIEILLRAVDLIGENGIEVNGSKITREDLTNVIINQKANALELPGLLGVAIQEFKNTYDYNHQIIDIEGTATIEDTGNETSPHDLGISEERLLALERQMALADDAERSGIRLAREREVVAREEARRKFEKAEEIKPIEPKLPEPKIEISDERLKEIFGGVGPDSNLRDRKGNSKEKLAKAKREVAEKNKEKNKDNIQAIYKASKEAVKSGSPEDFKSALDSIVGIFVTINGQEEFISSEELAEKVGFNENGIGISMIPSILVNSFQEFAEIEKGVDSSLVTEKKSRRREFVTEEEGVERERIRKERREAIDIEIEKYKKAIDEQRAKQEKRFELEKKSLDFVRKWGKRYKEMPFKQKVALSIGIAGVGILSAAASSVVGGTLAVMAITTNRLASGASTFVLLEGALENHFEKKKGKYSDSEKNRMKIELVALSGVIGIFGGQAIGNIANEISDYFKESPPSNETKGKITTPTETPVAETPVVESTTTEPQMPEPQKQIETSPPEFKKEYTVSKGDNMYKVLEKSFPEIEKLTGFQKTNAIENILTEIKKNPESFGIKSGDVDKIAVGEKINMEKIKEILENKKIGGSSIIERAKKFLF